MSDDKTTDSEKKLNFIEEIDRKLLVENAKRVFDL